MEQLIKGKKMNMTQVFMDNGSVVPVTIVAATESLNPEFENKKIEIIGTSKGKGFTGVMKKWNFAGVGESTRGQSNKQRSAGSIGAQTPGRVLKGKKMAGRHGNYRVTVKGSKIVKIDQENGNVFVLGPVPGARNSEVIIKVLE
jgi:large subunit ribosomal protein L3